MKVLQVNSSLLRNDSTSTRLADRIVTRLLERYPEARRVVRDLSRHPHPMLDADAIEALMTPEDQWTPSQVERVALDDVLIAEIQAADVFVMGVPMYNFNISVQLKSWLDAISRAKVTFRYTEKGPEGLLTGKKVFLALTRGGIDRDSEQDTQVPYLKTILGFLGRKDVYCIYAEGISLGADAVSQAFSGAEQQMNAVLA